MDYGHEGGRKCKREEDLGVKKGKKKKKNKKERPWWIPLAEVTFAPFQVNGWSMRSL
jgi:hypothetical protein